jgi:hypothetical protein
LLAQEKLRLRRSDIARVAGSAYYCHAERGNITELAKLNITLLKAEYHLPERQISPQGSGTARAVCSDYRILRPRVALNCRLGLSNYLGAIPHFQYATSNIQLHVLEPCFYAKLAFVFLSFQFFLFSLAAAFCLVFQLFCITNVISLLLITKNLYSCAQRG